MAATSSRSRNFVPDLEAATERAREANDRVTEVGRKASSVYLDGVEKYVTGLAQFERKLGEQSQVDALASLFNAHADLTEEMAKASISATRELITA
jgi:hypothetical protein